MQSLLYIACGYHTSIHQTSLPYAHVCALCASDCLTPSVEPWDSMNACDRHVIMHVTIHYPSLCVCLSPNALTTLYSLMLVLDSLYLFS